MRLHGNARQRGARIAQGLIQLAKTNRLRSGHGKRSVVINDEIAILDGAIVRLGPARRDGLRNSLYGRFV